MRSICSAITSFSRASKLVLKIHALIPVGIEADEDPLAGVSHHEVLIPDILILVVAVLELGGGTQGISLGGDVEDVLRM
jgi:hypothetical protein